MTLETRQHNGQSVTNTATRSQREGKRDYRVGKGRPPVEHQFKKGNKGRPKGIIDRRTWAKREVLEFLAKGDEGLLPRAERLKILLKSPDHSIRVQTEKFIVEHDWGRPKETIDLQGGLASAFARAAAEMAAERGHR